MFARLTERGWTVKPINYGDVIASEVFLEECEQIVDILVGWSLEVEEHIIVRGGGKSKQTQDLTVQFNNKHWVETAIEIQNKVSFSSEYPPDDTVAGSESHKIDHIIQNKEKKLIALEIEWNNKDEFYDRDFQAMRRFYELDIIDLGIIITRGPEIEDQLGRLISNYFYNANINNKADFVKLSERLIDEDGEERFSFPTVKQTTAIDKKVKSGMPYYEAAAQVFKTNKYGTSTTTWNQLNKRISRRDAGRTPMIFFGIPELSI